MDRKPGGPLRSIPSTALAHYVLSVALIQFRFLSTYPSDIRRWDAAIVHAEEAVRNKPDDSLSTSSSVSQLHHPRPDRGSDEREPHSQRPRQVWPSIHGAPFASSWCLGAGEARPAWRGPTGFDQSILLFPASATLHAAYRAYLLDRGELEAAADSFREAAFLEPGTQIHRRLLVFTTILHGVLTRGQVRQAPWPVAVSPARLRIGIAPARGGLVQAGHRHGPLGHGSGPDTGPPGHGRRPRAPALLPAGKRGGDLFSAAVFSAYRRRLGDVGRLVIGLVAGFSALLAGALFLMFQSPRNISRPSRSMASSRISDSEFEVVRVGPAVGHRNGALHPGSPLPAVGSTGIRLPLAKTASKSATMPLDLEEPSDLVEADFIEMLLQSHRDPGALEAGSEISRGSEGSRARSRPVRRIRSCRIPDRRLVAAVVALLLEGRLPDGDSRLLPQVQA